MSIVIWDATCCGTCKHCHVEFIDGSLYCEVQKYDDGNPAEVEMYNVCGWYEQN